MLLLADMGETVEILYCFLFNGLAIKMKNGNTLGVVAVHSHTKHSCVMHRGAFDGRQL
jgi:hypothetical protein